MKQYADTIELLKQSILSNDIIIFWAAVIEFGVMIATIVFILVLNICLKNSKKTNNGSLKPLLALSNLVYNVFITGITIFPLLGMLGTVFGLLGLDLASGDMDNIKNNFFIALTSTAWGIIFSVCFKLLHALFATVADDTIDASKKLIEEMDK